MSFNDMIATFQDRLNRGDCTAAQATSFLQEGIGRIQREARLPCMERQLVITTTELTDWIGVPSDLLEVIDLFVPGEDTLPKPLRKLPFRDLMRIPPQNWPFAYGRLQAQFWIRGQVPAGTTIQLVYYGQFTPFADPDDDNELSTAFPDLAVYGALSRAADSFEHPQGQAWEARYQQILGQVQGLANDLEMNGGPMEVRPMFQWE